MDGDAVVARLDSLQQLFSRSRRDLIQRRPRSPEKLDPTPVALPLGSEGPSSIAELVQQYVAGALSQHAAQQNFGTFEEEDDFDEEDPELLNLSGFEVTEYEFEEEIPPEPEAPPEPSPAPPQAEANPPPDNPTVDIT